MAGDHQRAGKLFGAILQFRRVIADHLLKGFFWSALAALFNQGATLIASLLLARILGLEAFGLYSIVFSLVLAIATISQGGAGLVAAKFIAEFRGAQNARVGNILKLCRVLTFWTGLVGSALLFVLAESLAKVVYQTPELARPFQLGAVAVFFQTGVAYLQGALQGFGAFDRLSRAGLISGTAHVACVTTGGALGGVEGALIGLSLASACRYAVFARFVANAARRERLPTTGRLTTEDLHLVRRFALPAGLSGFFTVPAQSIVMAILARLPQGAELVGLYAAVNQIRLMALQVPTILNSVAIWALNHLKGGARHSEFSRLYLTNVAASLAAALIVLVPLLVLLPEVLSLYGERFVVTGWFGYGLLLSVIPEALSAAVYQLVQSAERMWHSLFLIAVPRDAGFVALAYYLSGSMGLDGVAVAYLAAQVASIVATSLIAGTLKGRLRGQA